MVESEHESNEHPWQRVFIINIDKYVKSLEVRVSHRIFMDLKNK